MFQQGKQNLLRDHAALGAAVADGRAESWFNSADIDLVHLGIYDTSGTLREKRLPARVAARAFERGWSFIDAIQYWDVDDGAFSDRGSVHEAVAVDLDSGRHFPFEASSVSFAADFTGASAARSPRVQLQRMIERATALGVEVRSSWEFEFIVLDRSASDIAADPASMLKPAAVVNRCWSGLTPAVDAEVLSGLQAVLEAGDIPVNHLCSELGPGCWELALDHRGCLRSADDAATAKLYTKAFFERRGQTATFMAQLAEGFPGLGGHPSLSLQSLGDGGPLIMGDGPYGLSPRAGHAIAGIVRLLPELAAMAAPTVNSYRRYAPGNWAPRSSNWGLGNYTCALRVVADRPDEARLELRIPGADTAPHACMAMMLGAAVWGMEHELEPPAPIVAPVNGRDMVDPLIGPMPRSLLEAAESFGASKTAASLFGDEFVAHYADSRLAEEASCRRFVAPQERLRYLHQV